MYAKCYYALFSRMYKVLLWIVSLILQHFKFWCFFSCALIYRKHFITNDFLRQTFKIFGWPSIIIILVTCVQEMKFWTIKLICFWWFCYLIEACFVLSYPKICTHGKKKPNIFETLFIETPSYTILQVYKIVLRGWWGKKVVIFIVVIPTTRALCNIIVWTI